MRDLPANELRVVNAWLEDQGRCRYKLARLRFALEQTNSRCRSAPTVPTVPTDYQR
jgi:hypothetical protein